MCNEMNRYETGGMIIGIRTPAPSLRFIIRSEITDIRVQWSTSPGSFFRTALLRSNKMGP